MPSTNGHRPKRTIIYARVSTDSHAEVVPEALDGLSGEERMRVYEMLQLEVKPDTEGYEVSGLLCKRRPRGRCR
jgi:hypothetical protein